MPRKTDTREKVFDAADQLLIEGVRPTQQSIRDRIGTGSISTINKALNEWWQSIGERLNKDASRPDLPDQVIDSASRMWQQSLAYAEQALSEKAARLEALTEQSLKDSAAKVDVMAQELARLREQNARLLQDNERLSSEKISVQKEVLGHEERIIRLQAEKDTLERDLKQYSLLSGGRGNDSGAMDEEFMNLRVSLGISEQESKRQLKQVERLTGENALLRRDLLEQERASTAQIHELEKTIARQEIWIDQLKSSSTGQAEKEVAFTQDDH
ncbi:DNA-binding protein [Marinobacterium jannaschii]|uniref:DNA-binding protein n=1 Tax=Marinobacterium jannaschii TaxID=64970 RepID=UPI000481D0DA|nr:DNA-binding protein [Marinobacterium jannaschii]